MKLPKVDITKAIGAVVLGAAAFWIVNLTVQKVMLGFNGIDAPDDVVAFIAWAASRRPLGVFFGGVPFLISAAAAIVIALVVFLKKEAPGEDISPAKQYGSQRFSTAQERLLYSHNKATAEWPVPDWCETVEDDNIILSLNSKVAGTSIVNDRKDPIRRESQVPNRNMFIMAGSGAGKSYRFVTNQIMQMNGNMVFTDPSGELFRASAAFLENNGYDVQVIDLRDEEHILASTPYNPLINCRDVTSINSLVNMFISNTKGEDTHGDQQFFIDMEKNFYTCVCGMFVFWFKANGNTADCTLPGIIDYLAMAKADGAEGINKLDLVFEGTRERDGFDGFAQYIIDTYGEDALDDESLPENSVLTNYRTFKANAGAPEQMAAVVSSCAARLQRLNNPAIRKMLGRDELDLQSIDKRKRAIFFCIKSGGGPYDFVAAMALNQLFDISKDIGSTNGIGHLEIPLYCYLDELAQIGKIPDLEKLFAESRKFWINLCAIVQDGKQLEARYGKQSESIRANSAIFMYMGSSLFSDCEQISREMGSTTKKFTDYSVSNSASGKSIQESTRYVKVPLMSPEELYSFNEEDGLSPDECVTHYKQGMWFRDLKADPEIHPRRKEYLDAGKTDMLEWARSRRHVESAGTSTPEDVVLVDRANPKTIVIDAY